MKFALLATGLMALAASAQPPAPPPANPAVQPAGKPATAPAGPTDRAELRARAERRLADTKRQIERWEEAIKKLDAGAPVDEVEAGMRGPRPSQGGRSQDRPDSNRGPRGDGGPDHGPPSMGPPGGGAPAAKMTHEEVLAFLAKDFPEISKRFAAATKESPGMAGRIVDRVEPMVREIISERDPEMQALRRANFQNGFELLGASKAFMEAARTSASADESKKVADALRHSLGEHFDLQIKMHQQEVVMLQRRVKQLSDDLAEQQQTQKREEFILKRIEGMQRMAKERGERGAGERGGGAGGGSAPKR